jgi:hypothetical protein
VIDRIDVEDREFVLLELLRVEGVGEGDFDDRRPGFEDRVERLIKTGRFSGVPKTFL